MEGSEAVSEDEIKLIFEQATALSDKNRWYDFGGTVVYIDVEPKCICVWTKVRDKNYKSLIFLSGATTGFLVPKSVFNPPWGVMRTPDDVITELAQKHLKN